MSSESIEELLQQTVEKGRDKLLDLGNRNQLINCSFSATRGVIEIVTPDCETVWRRLAADSESGSDPMRFPWRRDLVPPPPEWFEDEKELSPPSAVADTLAKTSTRTEAAELPPSDDGIKLESKPKKKEWNHRLSSASIPKN